MMDTEIILERAIKTLQSKGFGVAKFSDTNCRQTYGIMSDKVILISDSYKPEIQLQTLLRLVSNYIVSSNLRIGRRFCMRLTEYPLYPREYRLDNIKEDDQFQTFLLFQVG